MPRIKKDILYKHEQIETINKIEEIMNLNETNQFTLYELDNNEELQNKIMSLLEDVKKYFSVASHASFYKPENIKRPWLSILKFLLKRRYDMDTCEVQTQSVRTTQYTLTSPHGSQF